MEDIEALGKHSSRIMVIAHSQGAKLAYDALKRLDECALSKICLISVGSGLKKLTQLEQLDAELTFQKESGDWLLSYFLPIGFLLPGLFYLDRRHNYRSLPGMALDRLPSLSVVRHGCVQQRILCLGKRVPWRANRCVFCGDGALLYRCTSQGAVRSAFDRG